MISETKLWRYGMQKLFELFGHSSDIVDKIASHILIAVQNCQIDILAGWVRGWVFSKWCFVWQLFFEEAFF